MDLSCENEDQEIDVIKVNGSLKSFVDFPLRVQFNAPINSTTRVCFEHNLGQHEHVEIDCTVSKNSKSVRQNFFALSVEQMSTNELVEKLFGDASEVYVSREQLANLASHIYTSFNVYEEYEIPESEFSSSFVEGLIQQTNSAFKPVPFETALQSLSKYSTRDLDPNEIRSNYSKVLKVKTSGDKTYIGVSDELSASDSQINSRRIGGSIGANFLLYGASLGVEFAKENEKNWTRSGKSIRDQLKDLNSHSKDHVEWQIDGDRIIPKSLNLGKLVKASFRNGLKFERIKRVVTNTILSRNFQIEYKTDHIKYDYLSNEIFDKTGLKPLRKVRTKSIVECLEACENLSQCHYVEFHNGCNLYDKSGYFYLVDKSSPRSGRNYVYRRRIYSKKELPGVLIISRHLKQIPHILDSESCWEECLKEKECYIVSYNYHNSTCSLFKYKTTTSWQYNVTNEEEFVSICYEKDLFAINKQTTDRTTNKPAAINKTNETAKSAYFNESIKYEKTQMSGFYLSMHVGSVHLCWNECLRRRNECVGVSFGDSNRCHLLKKGDYYTMRRFDDWVSIFTEEEWPNRLFIESTSNYKLKRVLKGHSSVVYCLAVLQNGDLASGSADKTIKLWSSKDGSHRQTLPTSQPVRALVVLHNGNLISASNDKTLTIWTTRNEISISRTISNHLNWVICLAVFANTDFASGSRDKSIRIWSSSGDHKRTLTGHTNTVLSLSVLPDGDLASGSADNTIIIWSSDDWRVKRTVSGHDGDVRSLVVLDTGFLASASNDNTIKIWDENMRLERTYLYHSGYVLALVVHPSGDLISGSVDKLIQVKGKRELINGSEWIKDTLKGHSNWVSNLAVFNNGDIVSASYDNTIVIWSKRSEL